MSRSYNQLKGKQLRQLIQNEFNNKTKSTLDSSANGNILYLVENVQ